MSKNLIIIVLIFIVILLLGVSGYLYVSQSSTKVSPTTSACTPATGETAFNGKVAYVEQYKQYILQTTGGKTYYLRTTSDQTSSLQGKLGKDAQVNGTLVSPASADVNVTTVCP